MITEKHREGNMMLKCATNICNLHNPKGKHMPLASTNILIDFWYSIVPQLFGQAMMGSRAKLLNSVEQS